MANGEIGDCSGQFCGWGVASGRAGCTTGDGSCWTARIVEAQPSIFHDNQLIAATRQIRSILSDLRPPEGRTLSFVHTPFGTLLAWVEHGRVEDGEVITIGNTPEEIADALGLIVEEYPPVKAS